MNALIKRRYIGQSRIWIKIIDCIERSGKINLIVQCKCGRKGRISTEQWNNKKVNCCPKCLSNYEGFIERRDRDIKEQKRINEARKKIWAAEKEKARQHLRYLKKKKEWEDEHPFEDYEDRHLKFELRPEDGGW